MPSRSTAPETPGPITSLNAGDILRRKRSYDPVTVGHPSDECPVTLTICDARFHSVHYARDFGRVEAMVEVTYTCHPAAMPQRVYLRTNVPLRPAGQRQELRRRLIQSAVTLSTLLNRLNGGDTTLRAA
ncbi:MULTISPECIES: hypothetical protein [unclassified Sulfitobacter]|uniref:hypothetical protein n=1 Tax=unclassified Sulfitobacter TaxID=196795 RepID=UPI0037451B6F